MTPFIEAALKILAGPKGNRLCTDKSGRRVPLRQAWTVAELQLWERSEGKAKTGIDTLDHWCSYTGA